MHPAENFFRILIIFVCGIFAYHSAHAGYVDFEGFADNDSISTQISGLTFSDATALTAGVTLNEIEFPPHSGSNVIAVFGGTLTISFNAPINLVSGYISYATATGATLSLYDINNALLADAFFPAPAAQNNIVSNQFISFSISGIQAMAVSLDGNNPFTFDDLAFIPEPASHMLIAIGILGICMSRLSEHRIQKL